MGTEASGGDASFKAFSPCFKNVVHAHMLSRQGETQVLVQTGLTPCVQPIWNLKWVVSPFLVFASGAF